MFDHQFLPLDEIEVGATDKGTRFYDCPGGRFPSVTTVIGSYKGEGSLEAWRKRVGEDEARRVSGQAKVRGREVHEIAERYLRNDPKYSLDAMPSNVDSFISIRNILDRCVGRIYGIEAPLWSTRLKTAGRTDLLCDWKDTPSVVDFKTARRPKKEGDIWGYFVQKTCYGMMLEERTGFKVEQIVTVMMVDHEPATIFIKPVKEYEADVQRVFVEAPRRGELAHI